MLESRYRLADSQQHKQRQKRVCQGDGVIDRRKRQQGYDSTPDDGTDSDAGVANHTDQRIGGRALVGADDVRNHGIDANVEYRLE